MEKYGWTLNEVNEQPYEQLMNLVIKTEKKESAEQVMNGADFIKSL